MDKAFLWSLDIIPNKDKWHECDTFTKKDWDIISLSGFLTDEFVKEFILQLDLCDVLINYKRLSEDTIKYVKLINELNGGNYVRRSI